MYNRAKVVFFSGIEKRLSHKVADKYQKKYIPHAHNIANHTPNAYTCHTKTRPAPHHIGCNQQQKTAQIQGKTTAQNNSLSRLKTPNFSDLFTVPLLSIFGYYNHIQYNKTTESVSANK